MDTQNKGADPFANIFQQVTNISKAHAYDIISKQRDELVKENEQLKTAVKYAEKVGYDTSVTNANLMAENSQLKEMIRDALKRLDEDSMTEYFQGYDEGVSDERNGL